MEEHPQEVQLPEVNDLNPLARTHPPVDCSVEPPQPPLLQEDSGRSSRPRRREGKYLRDKHLDHVLPDKIQ